MAATINTNIASINAQRNLALSGQSLNTTMQRLSSGLRVNSAKDDAAGLAIAERMNTQVKGLTVAARNANDGISLAQTAEGALGKVGDMLQRMRELAVQASNATNSASDREALQAEVSQLAAEIDRVAKQTNFNGQKILDGSFAGAVFQVGANSGDNVTLGALADTRSSKLSVVNYAQNSITGINANDVPPNAAIADHAKSIPAGQLKITVNTTPAQVVDLETIKPATSSLERLGQVVTAINNKAVDTGVTAYMSRNETTGTYEIQLMASKTDAAGVPFDVDFTGFTQETTGIGKPSSLDGILPPPPTSLTAPTSPSVTWPTAPGLNDTTGSKPSVPSFGSYLTDLAAIASKIADPEKTALQDKLDAFNSKLTTFNSHSWPAAGASVAQTDIDIWKAVEDGYDALIAMNLTAAINSYNATLPVSVDDVVQNSSLAAVLDTTSSVADFEAAIADLKTENPGLTLSGFDISKFSDTSTTPATWKEAPDGVDAALKSLNEVISKELTGDLNINTADHKVNERGLDVIDVRTQEGAWVALKKIDSAIDQINASRATLGAMQTRFETAVNNIDIQVENLSAARGRIVDADFAVETANLSRTQILQQAGTAMVAQANQVPQNVLQLLQG